MLFLSCLLQVVGRLRFTVFLTAIGLHSIVANRSTWGGSARDAASMTLHSSMLPFTEGTPPEEQTLDTLETKFRAPNPEVMLLLDSRSRGAYKECANQDPITSGFTEAH